MRRRLDGWLVLDREAEFRIPKRIQGKNMLRNPDPDFFSCGFLNK